MVTPPPKKYGPIGRRRIPKSQDSQPVTIASCTARNHRPIRIALNSRKHLWRERSRNAAFDCDNALQVPALFQTANPAAKKVPAQMTAAQRIHSSVGRVEANQAEKAS